MQLVALLTALQEAELQLADPIGCDVDLESAKRSHDKLQVQNRFLKAGFQKGWLLSPVLSLFIAKDRKNLGIGMENRQRDGFSEA